jgi:hypothetical protein
VQYAALKHLAATGLYKTRAKLPTIVFVHALNPFGFKHHRRVNEDNVDLNRNFLTAEEWVEVKALDPNYARQVIDLSFIILILYLYYTLILLTLLYFILLLLLYFYHTFILFYDRWTCTTSSTPRLCPPPITN